MMNLQVKGGFISEERTDYVFINVSYEAITLAIILLLAILFVIYRNQKKKNS